MRRLVTPLVAVALVVAACSGSADVAASVGNLDITDDDVLILRTIPEDAVSVNSAEFRQDLTTLIFQQIVADQLSDDYGVSIGLTDADTELDSQLASTGISVDEALASIGQPDGTRQLLVRNVYSGLLVDAAQQQILASPAFLERARETLADQVADDPLLLTEVCVRHILVEDEAAALDVLTRLEGGDDFAALAGEVSTDGSPGGDLGCAAPSRYVTEFADATVAAPVGELFGPVETQFGFHVLIVDERTVTTPEDAAADPLQFVPADQLLDIAWLDWFNDAVRAADVTVSPRIGTWFPDGPGITPPE